MVATFDAAAWIEGTAAGGKDELPPPGARRVGTFPVERLWQGHGAIPLSQVVLAQHLDPAQMSTQGRPGTLGKNGPAVLTTFPVADVDLARLEVQILHAEPQGFREAQARPVEQLGDEAVRPAHLAEDGLDFLPGEVHAESSGTTRPLDRTDGVQVEGRSIDKFLRDYSGRDQVRLGIWEPTYKRMSYVNVTYPNAYDDETKIYLRDILTEREGVKLSFVLMKQIADTQVVP
jgi:hypothetical protein